MLALLVAAEDAGAALVAGAAGAALLVSPPLLDFALSVVTLSVFALSVFALSVVVPLEAELSPLASALDVLLPPLPLLRKSVTYQPVPFSAKPAAVTCLAKLSVLHAGQSVSAGSLILRKVSCV